MGSVSKGELIVDITQLVHWSGNLTGIPRVMNEIAMRYAKAGEHKFVVWDKSSAGFLEVDINESLSRRGEGVFYKQETVEAKATNDSEVFNKGIKRIARRLKRFAPTLYEKAANRAHQQKINGIERLQIKPSDCLFVLWGEWGDATYREALVKLKKQRTTLVQVVYDMLPLVTPQYSGHSTEAMEAYYTEVVPCCDLILSTSSLPSMALRNIS